MTKVNDQNTKYDEGQSCKLQSRNNRPFKLEIKEIYTTQMSHLIW